jgi:hypothetical protein
MSAGELFAASVAAKERTVVNFEPFLDKFNE